jgi:hypothetical protein
MTNTPRPGLETLGAAAVLLLSLTIALMLMITLMPTPRAHADAPVAFPSGWRGKLLVMRGESVLLDQRATYVDSNSDGVMDPADKGWFAPGSTVKIAIALAAIANDGGRGNIARDLTSMLVVSDNAATNRLIDRIGGPVVLTRKLRAAGYRRLTIGRPMLGDVGELPECEEASGRLGNCASARELLKSLRAVVEGGKEAMGVSKNDRLWLARLLAQTPRQAGYAQADDFCRFARRSGLQKCGISPWSPQHWSNIGYFPSEAAYVFVTVVPPAGTARTRILEVIDSAVTEALSRVELPRKPTFPTRAGKAIAKEATWLKRSTRDSTQLGESEKCRVPAGTVLAYTSRLDIGNHARLTLEFADVSCPGFPLEGVHVFKPKWIFKEP